MFDVECPKYARCERYSNAQNDVTVTRYSNVTVTPRGL